MEKKKCNFCKRAKSKFSFYIFFSVYVATLCIWGQVELIKFIIKLINS